MRCKLPDGTITTVTWRLFYANCRRVNLLCNAGSNAFVAAAIICRQRLF